MSGWSKVKQRAYSRTWYKAKRKKVAVRARAWYKANREKADAYARAWQKANPEKVKAIARLYQLRRKYGMTERDYQNLLERQKGGCALCGRKPKERRLVVDHDHRNGKVRGILCAKCNEAVGACS